MKSTTQNINFILIALILVFLGCQQEQQEPQEAELKKELHVHFALIGNGSTGSARVRLRQRMDIQGESAQPLFLMGLSYHHDKHYARAVEWFKKSTAFDEDQLRYPPSWHFLGWSHYYLGNTAESESAFAKYLEMNPEEGDTLFGLGLLAMEAGEFNNAEALFDRSIAAQEHRPQGQAKAMARLADVHVELDRWEIGIRKYEHALQLNPDLYEAWYHLAMAYRRTGDDEAATEATVQFEKSRLRVRPDLARTRFPE